MQPMQNIEPNQVIKIQLDGLMKNDNPSKIMGLNKLGNLLILIIKYLLDL